MSYDKNETYDEEFRKEVKAETQPDRALINFLLRLINDKTYTLEELTGDKSRRVSAAAESTIATLERDAKEQSEIDNYEAGLY